MVLFVKDVQWGIRLGQVVFSYSSRFVRYFTG